LPLPSSHISLLHCLNCCCWHRFGKLLSRTVWLRGLMSRGAVLHGRPSDPNLEESCSRCGWRLVGRRTERTHRNLPFAGCGGMPREWRAPHTASNMQHFNWFFSSTKWTQFNPICIVTSYFCPSHSVMCSIVVNPLMLFSKHEYKSHQCPVLIIETSATPSQSWTCQRPSVPLVLLAVEIKVCSRNRRSQPVCLHLGALWWSSACSPRYKFSVNVTQSSNAEICHYNPEPDDISQFLAFRAVWVFSPPFPNFHLTDDQSSWGFWLKILYVFFLLHLRYMALPV
jgi:hypothetical protein